MSVSRLLTVISVVLILTITAFLFLERAKTEGPRVVVGEVDDFPVGSITRMELRVHVPDPHPEIAELFLDGEGDLLIFIVNHPDFGILALSLFDPHLGCRIGLAGELPSDTGAPLPSEIAFVNPCHGEKYDLAGTYVAGPAPRGMDRYRVTVSENEVTVDFSAFEYGPDRVR